MLAGGALGRIWDSLHRVIQKLHKGISSMFALTTRGLALRRVATRSFASEAPAAPVVVKKGSSFGQRLVSFTVGFAVAAGIGLYQITEDVDKSTREIQTTIGALKNDVIAQNAALTKRIEQLEKQRK